MSALHLRQSYTRRFARMERYSTQIACSIVLMYLSQIIGSIAIGAYLLSMDFGWSILIIDLTLMIFIGTRLRGLNNIIHECSHSTFSKDRAVNTLVGKFCAVILFNSFSDYRDEHLTHHAHLGDYDHDQDLQGIRDLKLHEELSVLVVLRHIITPFVGGHLPYYLNLNFSTRDGNIWLGMKSLVFAGIILGLAFFPLSTLLFVIVPFVIFYSTLNYWADCLDHAGIVAVGDDLYASRNILAPRLIRCLFFPRNDCFHLVHHLFPHIPARHLEDSHRLLELDDTYSSCPNAVHATNAQRDWKSINSIPAK